MDRVPQGSNLETLLYIMLLKWIRHWLVCFKLYIQIFYSSLLSIQNQSTLQTTTFQNHHNSVQELVELSRSFPTVWQLAACGVLTYDIATFNILPYSLVNTLIGVTIGFNMAQLHCNVIWYIVLSGKMRNAGNIVVFRPKLPLFFIFSGYWVSSIRL